MSSGNSCALGLSLLCTTNIANLVLLASRSASGSFNSSVSTSLYESLPGTTEEQLGQEVLRTQWLGPSKTLLGRRALIVDEVDDSRSTLHYAVTELQKDVETELLKLPEAEREANKTKFAIFVVHNKLKPKAHELPDDIPYYAGAEVGDVWLDYPWEMKDIDEHDRKAALSK